MKSIDWKRKLTSRKFWAAVIAFITTLCVAFGVKDITAEQIAAVITAAATMIAYIIGEGLTDAAGIKTEAGNENETKNNGETGCE